MTEGRLGARAQNSSLQERNGNVSMQEEVGGESCSNAIPCTAESPLE
jgi:hypothetical protein